MVSISNSMLENFSMMLVAQFSLLNSRPHFHMFIGLLQFNVFQFLKFKETLKNHHLLYHPNLFLPICSLYPEMKLYCSNDLKLEIISNHFFLSCIPHAFVVVQLLSCVWVFVTPWTAARQSSRFSQSPEVSSNSCSLSRWYYPVISHSATLFSCFQSFPASGKSNESALLIRWPK